MMSDSREVTIYQNPNASRPRLGRPSKYTPELATEICRRLAEGESLRSICRDDHVPAMSNVCNWLFTIPKFQEQYTRAREIQAEIQIDEIVDIADNSTNDWMERHGKDDIGWQENGDSIRRSHLRIETRKWCAAKLRPKKYGDRVQTQGQTNVNIDLRGVPDDQLERYVAAGRAIFGHLTQE
jgi:hypothetical protein